ncbi:MAG: hypothetical protein NCW75_01485 [Phycisphaera sp.]|nr:MAG: hypothetical protein NCW75_01485 [Phycisphaera sp.]
MRENPSELPGDRAGGGDGEEHETGHEARAETGYGIEPEAERPVPAPPIPEHLRPSAPPTTPCGLPSGPVRGGALCVSCGYELAGLSPHGECPECGTPIARSLKGDLLAFAPAEYLAKLHRGATIVVVTILVMVVFAVLSFGVGMYFAASSASGTAPALLEGVLGLGGLALGLVLLYGWWLLSTPMPMHESTRMDTARRWVRGLLIASAALTAAQFVVGLALGASSPTVPAGSAGSAGMGAVGILVVAGLLSTLVGVAGYVVQMLYVAWLGQRIPDQDIHRRGKRNAWLVPLLATVGMIIIIGPLIALVLYWNLVDALRKQLKHLRENQDRLATQPA